MSRPSRCAHFGAGTGTGTGWGRDGDGDEDGTVQDGDVISTLSTLCNLVRRFRYFRHWLLQQMWMWM